MAVGARTAHRRLGLDRFTKPAPLVTDPIEPRTVTIPLQQPIGMPPTPVVAASDTVAVGDMLAQPAKQDLSVPIHASIDGVVTSVGDTIVIERAA